jgi:YegS/Rv2252/BmrU family lipid kinase
MPELLIIVNPRSANASTGRRWREIESYLGQRLGVPFDVAFTQHPGHATTLAREAAGRYGCVVAMGGDGTINEVLNGLVDDQGPLHPELRLAILPRGTGADFVRTLGIPHDLKAAAARLAAGKVREVDVAKVRFRDFAGQDAVRFFINEASVGMGGAVCQVVNRSSKRLGGRLTFLRAILVTVLRYPDHWVTLTLDGGQPSRIRLNNAWVANGQYSGGGIRMTPRARLDDGLLDVVTIAHEPLMQKIVGMRKLRSGGFISQPNVTYATARHIELLSQEMVPIEVEGEPIGTLPATFELLDKRLKVVA